MKLQNWDFNLNDKKKKFNNMAFMWHRGQFEYKFQKVVISYIFFNKWVILTQNSTKTAQVRFCFPPASFPANI